MELKSYSHGQGSVLEFPQQEKEIPRRNLCAIGEVCIAESETQKFYGEGRWDKGIPELPLDNWLQYQAQSYLGRYCSMEEAKELWDRIDIQTRRPPPVPATAGPLSRLLRALRAGRRNDSLTVETI